MLYIMIAYLVVGVLFGVSFFRSAPDWVWWKRVLCSIGCMIFWLPILVVSVIWYGFLK